MDLLSHTVVGVAIGAAAYPRWGRRGILCAAAAAVLPDAERAVSLWNPAAWIEMAYGAGHSAVAISGLALLLALVFRRILGNWGDALLAAAAGLIPHITLDLLSGPGVRLLWPWTPQFYGAGIVARYDVLILLVLGLALLGPALLNLVNQDIGASPYRPQNPARAGLAVVGLLLVARGAIYSGYQDRVEPPSTAGFVLEPSPFNPFTWYVITDLGPAYTVEEYRLGSFGPPLRFRKAEPNRAFETAAESPLGQAFLGFAVFPHYSLERGARGMLVRIFDMRFYLPGGDNRQYSVEIEVTPQLRVVAQRARM